MKKELSTIQFMKKLFAPIWDHPRLCASLVGKGILRTSMGYISVLFMQYIVDFMEHRNYKAFNIAVITLICFYIVYEIVNYISRNEGWVRFWFPFRKVIHQLIMSRYVTLDNTETEKIGTGKTISVIDTGINAWTDAVMEIVEYTIKGVFSLGFGMYFTAKVDILYALLYVIVLVCVTLLVKVINNKVILHRNKRRDYQNYRTHQVVKIIMSKFEILMSNKAQYEISLLDKSIDSAQYHNIKMNNYLYWVFNIPAFFVIMLRVSVYLFVGYGYFEGHYSLAEFTAFLSVLLIFDRTIMDVVSFYKDFTKDIANITKLRDLVDNTPLMIGYTDGLSFTYKQGDISLKDISFSYSEGKPVFENFSLNIQGGKKTALVGLSGSGKTTLMKLISGYMRPDSGEILVDGQQISPDPSLLRGENKECVSLQSYYAHIGYLTQEPSVFDGTIRENLMYGVDQGTVIATKEAIHNQGQSQDIDRHVVPTLVSRDVNDPRDDALQEAIKLAHCDFIYDLPHGLDTEIGEKGIRLSGGQRQRLAIAKIFLKNPQLIFLDEPTSALDSLSEKLVSDAFHNLFRNRTVIIIAHRLQTVKESDEIIVLGNKGGNVEVPKGGKESDHDYSTVIVERGTHKTLSKAKGVYQEMLELQSGFNF